MATASPWRRSYSESCSSLCALQWPKVEGAGLGELEGVAPLGDVLEVEHGAAPDDGFGGGEVAGRDRAGGPLDLVEERGRP
jgi:hypothetical protein